MFTNMDGIGGIEYRCILTTTSSVGSLLRSVEPFSVRKTLGGSLTALMWMLMVTDVLAGGISGCV